MSWEDVKQMSSDRQIEYINKLQVKNHGEILDDARKLTYQEASDLIQRELASSKRGD